MFYLHVGIWKFLRGETLKSLQRLLASLWLVTFSGATFFLGTSATILSHARLSYSSAYTAYDGGVMALSEIVVD